MDFDLNEEQQLLKDSVDRLFASRNDFETRRKIQASDAGWSRENWGAYAEMGLLGLPFSEADGGFDAGPVSVMIVMEAIGRSLALEPYLSTVVLAGSVLRRFGNAAHRAEYIPRIIAGDMTATLAFAEPQSRYDLHDVALAARKDGASYVLDGRKGLVLHGGSADRLIVTARTAGGRRDHKGISVFVVDARAEGVSRRSYPTQDGGRAAEVELSGVRVPAEDLVGTLDEGLAIITRAAEDGIAALCAEAVGLMADMQAMTVDYLKTRKQFGTTIGSFQALQHRASDMVVELEQARSMMLYATMNVDEPDAMARATALSAAKLQIGKAIRFIGQQSIQMHGGIGMTMEYKVGHLFKRATMIDLMFGDSDHHLEKLAASDAAIV
ncbi:MAG TPA: acyl-CoA dehydrogenase [Beijerinckiaceae bacterium]|nr:acyl-CoA dehydrogenase [Beijerinckiaceae bacterium]